MKFLIFVVAAGLLFTGFSITVEAQILDRLKRKGKEAAERKAEEKVSEQVEQLAEQIVEESWNSIFGDISDDSLYGDKSPFAMNSDVKTEEVYDFDAVVTMKIETFKKKGESEPPVIMDMHFNKNELYTGTKFKSEEREGEEGEPFIIYDFKNSAMIMLMSKDRDKFSFAYDWEKTTADIQAAQNQDEEADREAPGQWQDYTKIGSKNILGYDCDGWRSESNNQVSEVWVSREADFGAYKLIRANANTKQLKGKIPSNYPDGMIMEMSAKNQDSGEKTVMKVIDIMKNARITYAMADYPTLSFDSGNTP